MRAYQDLREFLSVPKQERELAAAACALTKLGE
jgi:hypothetical protein